MNATRGAADLLAAKARRQGAPVTVLIQVTARCNYACIHCYETHDAKDELTFAELDRVLGQIADEGTMFLTLTGGEFFMRRDADDILRAARRRKFAVKLLTTGHFVDDARADLIRDLGAIQVDLSFYSADPTVHDHVTQIPHSWRRTLLAVTRLRERKVPVVLKSPVMGVNAAGLPKVAELARELGCEFTFDPKVTGREDGDLEPTSHRVDDATLRGFYADETMGIFPNLVASMGGVLAGTLDKPLESTPCRAGQDIAAVNPVGQVFACHSLVGHPVGDLRTQSFREVWRGSPGLARIRGLTWGRIEECNVCDVRAYCTRCHAMADLEDGRIDGPSREACRHAVIIRDLLRDKGLVPDGDTALPPPIRREREREEDKGLSRIRPPALRVVG
jgi:radical SAM protein with 4Fe4S-binding SPASM domain